MDCLIRQEQEAVDEIQRIIRKVKYPISPAVNGETCECHKSLSSQEICGKPAMLVIDFGLAGKVALCPNCYNDTREDDEPTSYEVLCLFRSFVTLYRASPSLTTTFTAVSIWHLSSYSISRSGSIAVGVIYA